MTKKFFYVASMILCAMFVFNACSDSNDSKPAVTPDPQTGTGISQGTAVKPANMKMSGLSGFVYDAEGNVLSGVTVTSGDETFVTGSDGGFKLDKVNSKSGRTIVKFSCGGYVDVVRSYNTKDGDVWEVVMLS
ncbi:MAG: carboxypeptidase regulatory-like domain-containing protein, partial [Bacteroidaceae bacterium]|nr:carboxypeptidase regulatory-like domain-containing protein [Bacteroidaceae bacterium]